MDKHESELVALFSFSERTLHILTCKTFFFFKSTTLRAHPLLLFLESSWIEIYLPLFSLSLSKALECTRASFFFFLFLFFENQHLCVLYKHKDFSKRRPTEICVSPSVSLSISSVVFFLICMCPLL